jgi:gamma-glutamyltranspeptidase/glutathione hydrolase
MPLRRFACLLAIPLLIAAAGCSDVSDTLGLSGSASTPAARTPGVAVADEPLAARTGAAILTQGGSAADAVTAMFFTLTATYPASAGLGGGGICLVRDAGGRVQEFDFLPRRAANNGPFGVPGAARGFYDLQKAFGTLPWQRTIAPGESYAATGYPISYSLAQRIVAAQAVLRQDPMLAAQFLDASDRPKPQGAVIVNTALAQTLGALRLNGPDGFYAGAVAAEIESSAGFSAAEFGGYRSGVTAVRPASFGAYAVALPGPQTGAGTFASTLLANMSRAAQGQTPDAAAASAVRQTLAGFRIAGLPPDLGATGFAAVDRNGQAATCAVTLNGPFGAGRSVATTGVTLASSPTSQYAAAATFLTPLLASDSAGQVALAGSGTGGPNGAAAMEYILLKRGGGLSVIRPGEIRSTGAAPFVSVNAISCQDGLCVGLPDPGGHGLGAAADEPAPQ